MKIQTLIILSLVFVVSCKCNKTSTETRNNNAKIPQIEPSVIAKGNLYGSGSEGITKQNLVIENQGDWDDLMAQMNKVNNVSDSFTETKIDFLKSSIIAIFADVKGSGGHKIELDISNTSKNTLVKVNHIAPKGNATSVMTQPYYIAKILKTDLPIVFE